jgi:hypothetical protein
MRTVSRTARYEFAWCAALCVLVVNDHALKGSGLVAPAITGKLSDFAGLFVAPVLLTGALVRLGFRGSHARLTAFLSVGVAFAAIKLSAAAAAVLESLVSRFGLTWKVWSDPSDLLALAVFPWAIRAATVLADVELDRPRRALHTLAAAAGGLACVATSAYEPYQYSTSAHLTNATRARREFMVLRANVPLACEALAANAQALRAGEFEPAFCAGLEPGQVVPLDRDFRGYWEQPEAASPGETRACDAVVLKVGGYPDLLVFWQETRNYEIAREHTSDTWDLMLEYPNGVVFEQIGNALIATGTGSVQIVEFAGQLASLSCAELPAFDDLDPDWD